MIISLHFFFLIFYLHFSGQCTVYKVLINIKFNLMLFSAYSIPFTDNDIEEVKAMFDTNIFGVMRVTQTFIPLLIASGFGRIVNIGK